MQLHRRRTAIGLDVQSLTSLMEFWTKRRRLMVRFGHLHAKMDSHWSAGASCFVNMADGIMSCRFVQVNSSFSNKALQKYCFQYNGQNSLLFMNFSSAHFFISFTSPFFLFLEAGCADLQNRDNGMVKVTKNKLRMELSCEPGFILASSGSAFCDGNNWNRQLGECRPIVGLSKRCDFETQDKCGWTQDADSDFDWVRRNGWNSSEKLVSGPNHDHTVCYRAFFRKHRFLQDDQKNFL